MSNVFNKLSLLGLLGSFLVSLSLWASESIPKLIDQELKADSIALGNPIKGTENNPLKSLIRPAKTPLALQYEYHAWSELNSDRTYSIYAWEPLETASTEKKFVLAHYTSEETVEEVLAFIRDQDQREALMKSLKEERLVGGLTKLSLKEGSFLERFKILQFAPQKSSEPQKSEAKSEEASKYPYGIPVPGKAGYMYSPAPGGVEKGNIIDAIGMKPGQMVRDPYTQEIIRVP